MDSQRGFHLYTSYGAVEYTDVVWSCELDYEKIMVPVLRVPPRVFNAKRAKPAP